MKQLSIFVVVLLCFNNIVHITNTRAKEFEAPQIIHRNYKEINNDINDTKSLISSISEEDGDLNQEKMIDWINKIEEETKSDQKTELTKLQYNLEGIKYAASKIQKYLLKSSKQIEASINAIDLKVNEINMIDEKISSIKPNYKKQLEKISNESGSLMKALKKEKKTVEGILAKIKSENKYLNKVSRKSDDLEKKMKLNESLQKISKYINTKLAAFMNLDNFEDSRKKFLQEINNELEDNYSSYFSNANTEEDYESISNKLLNKYWRQILTNKDYVVSSRKTKGIDLEDETNIKVVDDEEEKTHSQDSKKISKRGGLRNRFKVNLSKAIKDLRESLSIKPDNISDSDSDSEIEAQNKAFKEEVEINETQKILDDDEIEHSLKKNDPLVEDSNLPEDSETEFD